MSKKQSKINIKPLRDRVLVEPLAEVEIEKTTSAGIIIPETINEEKPNHGIVVAFGDSKSLNVGDKVIFSQYGYDEVKVGDTEYYLVKEEDVLAIIK